MNARLVVAVHLMAAATACGQTPRTSPAPPRSEPIAVPSVQFTKLTRDGSSSVFRELTGRTTDGKTLWSLTFDSVGGMAMCPDHLAICAEVDFEGQARVVRIDAAGVTQWSRVVGDAGLRGVVHFRKELGAVEHVICESGIVRRFALGNGSPLGEVRLAFADEDGDLEKEGIRQCATFPGGLMVATSRGHVALFDLDGRRRRTWTTGDPAGAEDTYRSYATLHLMRGRPDLMFASEGPFLSVYDIVVAAEVARFDFGEPIAHIARASQAELYVTGRDGALARVGIDGAVRWRRRLPLAEPGIDVGEDGTIAVGDRFGYLFAVAPDGRASWGYVDPELDSMDRQDLATFAVASAPPWATVVPAELGAQPDLALASVPVVSALASNVLTMSPTEAWFLASGLLGLRFTAKEAATKDGELVHLDKGARKETPRFPLRTIAGLPIELAPSALMAGPDARPWLVGERVSRALDAREGPSATALRAEVGVGTSELWTLRVDASGGEGAWLDETKSVPAALGAGPWDAPGGGRLVLCGRGHCAERVGDAWVESMIPEFGPDSSRRGDVYTTTDETWFVAQEIVWRGKAGRLDVAVGAPRHVQALWGAGGDGAVWAASDNRLFRYQGGKWTWQPAPLRTIEQLTGSSGEDVWARAGGGLAHFDGETWRGVDDDGYFEAIASAGPLALWTVSRAGVMRATITPP